MASDKNNYKTVAPNSDEDATQIHDLSHLRRQVDDVELEMDADTIQFEEQESSEPESSEPDNEAVATLEAEIAERNKSINELEFNLEQVSSRNTGLDKELKDREELTEKINQELRQIKSKFSRREKSLQSTKKRLTTEKKNHKKVQTRLTGVEEDLSAAKTELTDVKNQMLDVRSSFDQLEEESQRAALDAQKAAEAAEATRKSELQEIQSRLEGELESLQATLDSEVESLQMSAAEASKRAENAESESSRLLADLVARNAAESNSDRDSSPEIPNVFMGQLAAARQDIRDLRGQIVRTERYADEMRRKLKTQTDSANAARAAQYDISKILDTTQDRATGLKTRLDEEEERRKGLETELKKQTQELQEVQARLENEMQELKSGLELELKDSGETQERELESTIKAHEDELRDSKDSLEREIEEMRESHKKELKKLKLQAEDDQRKLRFELTTAEETLADHEIANEQLTSNLLSHQSTNHTLEGQLGTIESRFEDKIGNLEKGNKKQAQDIRDLERQLENKDAAISGMMSELASRSQIVEAIKNLDEEIDIDLTNPAAAESVDDASGNKQRVSRLLIGNVDGQELQFPLFKNRLTIGRTAENDIQLETKFISRRHAVIVTEGDDTRIVDWGSKNGIRVNREFVKEQFLHTGDVVTIGTASFRYEERGKR